MNINQNQDGSSQIEPISNIEVPLVYTEFKSSATPDKSFEMNHSIHCSPGLNYNKKTTIINRHSYIAYLESTNTTTIWLILFMPIVVLLFINISMGTSFLANQYDKIPFKHMNMDEKSIHLLFQIQNISFARYIQSYVTIHPSFNNQDCQHKRLESYYNYHQDNPICYLSQRNNLNIEVYLLQNQHILDNNIEYQANRYEILNITLNLNDFLHDYYSNKNISSLLIPIPSINLDISNALLYNKLHYQLNNSSDMSTILSNYQLIYYIHLYPSNSTELPIIFNNNFIELTVSIPKDYSIISVCIVKVILSISILIWLLFILQTIFTHAYQLYKKLSITQQLPLESEYLLSHNNSNDNNNINNIDNNQESIHVWHLILPEQYLSILFLIFLLLYIDPIESSYILFNYYYNHSIILSEKISIIINFFHSCSLFGLYYCILVYIDGLSYNNNALNNDEIKAIRLHQIKKIFTNNNRYKSSKTPDELFLHTYELANNSNNNNNKNEYNFWRRRSYTTEDNNELDRRNSLKSYEKDPIKVAKLLYVTCHHPFSRDYLDFIMNKLLLIVITWLVIGVYWFYLFPYISTVPNITWIDIVLYNIANMVLISLNFIWIWLIIQGFIDTGRILRLSRFMNSRFRQIAFRIILFQVNGSIIIYIMIVLWNNIYQFKLYHQVQYDRSPSFISFHINWISYSNMRYIITTSIIPNTNIHNLDIILAVITIIISITICVLPIKSNYIIASTSLEDRELQSFYTLTKDLPIVKHVILDNPINYTRILYKLQHYIKDSEYDLFMKLYLSTAIIQYQPQYFCLETSLKLLEICYQTYFHTSDTIKELETYSNNDVLVEPFLDYSLKSSIKVSNKIDHNNHNNNNRNNRQRKIKDEKLLVEKDINNETNNEINLESWKERKNPITSTNIHKQNQSNINNNNNNSNNNVQSTNPFNENDGNINNKDKTKETKINMNISQLGYTLKDTFICNMYSIFGLLCVKDNTIVISFRGSQIDNILTDLKFVTMSLPSLERNQDYFINLLRIIKEEDNGIDISNHIYENIINNNQFTKHNINESIHDVNESSKLLQSKYEYNLSRNIHSNNQQQQQQSLYQDNEDDYISTKNNEINHFIHSQSKQLWENINKIGTKVPIMNQNFSRVHVGFWEAYQSIREQYLLKVMKAIYIQWKTYLQTVSILHSTSKDNYEDEGLDSYYVKVNPSLQHPKQYYGTNNHNNIRYNKSILNNMIQRLEIFFCGHSLGAAIASLASLELSCNMKYIMEVLCKEECFNTNRKHGIDILPSILSYQVPHISLYVYGSPRIGNTMLANYIKQNIPTIYRLQVNGDIISMLPKFIGFYRHIGTAVIIDEEENGNIIINPTMIESSLLLKNTGSFLNHSLDKYRICLESCFHKDELYEYLHNEFI